jgi:predicted O-linked N-acetylglucosamine transferase (SPINDLY family)
MTRKDALSTGRPGANDPCPCGSGKQYTNCHGAGNAATHRFEASEAIPAATLVVIAGKARAAGRVEEAQNAYLAALECDPRSIEALLGMALLAEGAGDDAASLHYHTRLAQMHPKNPHALFALGNYQAKRFDFARARADYRAALALAPDVAGLWNNLGNVEKYLGNLAESIACYDRAVAADPDNAALHSNALVSLYYDDSTSHDELYERHVAWAARHAARFYPQYPSWPNSKQPERRLRLGYVSEGFDGRILGHFLRNVLRYHDRERFTVYAYSATRQPDGFTAELRPAFDHWREIEALAEDAVATQVREDAIDILVDLDGHTPNSRLLVFARKPAPVQITWLGYFNTTGMQTIDYILTDSNTTPSDSPQRFSEVPLRLADSRICYAPVPYAPAVSSSPCLERGWFTFGSFNRYDKLGPEIIACWAAILRRVPGSRLVVKNSAIAVPCARSELARRFAEHGIAAERVELRERSPHPAMLAEYGDIDLGLDTFPYNGGLTTCEALWQGVPIVAIEEERMISRQTSAMLRLIGAAQFIASNRDEYVALAARWAGERDRLDAVRRSQRERMRLSALCDGPRFTRNLEHTLRAAWRGYCEQASSAS